MNARDLVRRAIGEKAVLDEAKLLHDQTRAALLKGMEPGDRIKVKDGDTDLGMAYVTDPSGTLRVVDEAAFVAWVAENHPGAIIQAVSPAWQRSLLAKGADDNGEVPDGCEVVKGNPTLTVKPTPDARSLARSLVIRELS